jgi:hypothetical protein
MGFLRTGFNKNRKEISSEAKLRDIESKLGLKQNKLEVIYDGIKPINSMGEEGEMRLQWEDGALMLYVKTMGHWYSTVLDREYDHSFYNLDGPQSHPAIYNRIQFDMSLTSSTNQDRTVIAQCPVVLPPHAVIWNIACGVKSVANSTYDLCIARSDISGIVPFDAFTDSTCDTDTTAGSGSTFGDNPKIIRMNDTSNLAVGMTVSGTGITNGSTGGDAVITQIDSSTLFRIHEDVASDQTDTTLKFAAGIRSTNPGVYNHSAGSANELLGLSDDDTASTDSSSASDISADSSGDLNNVWFSPGWQGPIGDDNNYIYILNAGNANGDTDKTVAANISIYLEYFGFDFRLSQDQVIAGNYGGSGGRHFDTGKTLNTDVAESIEGTSGSGV